ncbi:MAG: prohibitin family protein [Chitinivibrionia bacterium]|jgi:regulator of protease activity HflC (stomatin/prohibitin superfamily)|nr:prohibitin family protein [Chitinivibrionia bacterium]
MNERGVVGISIATIIIVVLIAVAASSIYTVKSGERALVFTWGKLTAVSGEGFHFKMPVAQEINIVDIRVRKTDAPAEAASKNMQLVQTVITVNYRLDASRLIELYSTVGLDVENKVIASRVQEVVKAAVARYTADELLVRREIIKDEISESLTQQLSQYFIIVEVGGVQITNFSFSKEFDKAIEEKQIAEQKALKAKNDLERIKVEAEQQVAHAQGQAEAIRIQAEAIRAQGGKEYVQLKAIEKWNGQLPTYMGNSGPLPFIEIK